MDFSSIVRADALIAVAALAFLNTAIIGYFAGPIFDHFKWPRQFILYVALLTGMVLGLVIQIPLFVEGLFSTPVVDKIVIGLLIGGGSSLIHDLTDRNQPE